MSIYVTTVEKVRNQLNVLAIHHILYTMSILMNFVTMTAYWSVLHEVVLQLPEFVDEVGDDKWFARLARLYVVHIVPGVVCLLNTYCTNSVLSSKLLKVLWAFSTIFTLSNFVATMKSERPVYWFLPWDPVHESILICLGMTAATSLIYFLFMKIDEFCKYQYLINAL